MAIDLSTLNIEDTDREAINAAMREQQTALETAQAEALAAKRQVAMARLGVNTAPPQGKFFAEHYAGDINDEVGLRNAAIELGVPLGGGQAIVPEPIVDDGSTDARNALASGASNAAPVDPDPRQLAAEAFNDALARGAKRDGALADAFRSRAISAYTKGDQRGLISDRAF